MRIAARLATPPLDANAAPESASRGAGLPDEAISAAEAARMLGMSRRWLYRQAPRLPFTRKIGRAVRFSRSGITRWLATRRPA
jgi:excisionase family DNA binding protein